jgi:tetratricopeptide (TPR) repeat protein
VFKQMFFGKNRRHSVMHCWLACFFVLAISIGTALAQSPPDFDVANRLYSEGKFSDAKQHYESLVRAGNLSANLFYNLGNAEWKLGNLGAAALNYERALRLEPTHPEARANLQFVRNQTGAKVEAPRWWQRLFVDLKSGTYAITAAIAAWLAIFGFAAIALRVRRETGALWLGAIACILVCVYALSAIYFLEKNSSLAVVIGKRAEARFAPADTASLSDTLPTGSHVRVLRELGAWTYCELPNDARAWIASSAIERVKPQS